MIKRITFLILAVFLSPLTSYAANASFYLSPETGVYTVGEKFPVSVVINTDGANITAAGGKLEFNNKELKVVSVLKEGSLFTSWIGSNNGLKIENINNNGVIPFEGFISEGYAGDKGHIMTVTFEALSDIASRVKFQTGSAILAADQKATNILTQMNSGVYTLNAQEVVPTIEYVAAANTDTLTVTSSTHPDEDGWYKEATTMFSWVLKEGTKNIRLLFDKKSTSIPTVFYSEPITEKTIEGVEEGVWYFHLQTKNDTGWGDVVHYRVQIDMTPPEYFNIQEQEREDLADPNPVFVFDALDAMSGVHGYEISINGGVGTILPADASSTETVYQLTDVKPGRHTLSVRAIDHAGNGTEQEITFSVKALEVPYITTVSHELIEGSVLAFKGMTYPDSEIIVWVQKDDTEAKNSRVLSNHEGNFTYVLEQTAEEGEYKLWAQAKDPIHGAISESSEQVTIIVTKPGIIIFGKKAIGYLSILVPMIGLVVLLFVFLWFGWYKFRVYKRRIRKEVDEAEDVLHKEFSDLKKVTEREVTSLENAQAHRALTPEEKSVIKRLKGSVSQAEQIVGKEVTDIKRVAVHKEETPTPKDNGNDQNIKQEQPQTQQTPKGKMQIRIEKLH